jgi:hypothetical protein
MKKAPVSRLPRTSGSSMVLVTVLTARWICSRVLATRKARVPCAIMHGAAPLLPERLGPLTLELVPQSSTISPFLSSHLQLYDIAYA